MFTYSISLICLTFVVNGERCQRNWRIPVTWYPKFFHIIFSSTLKISFVVLELLKILKYPFEEDSPIVAPEISRILSFPYSHLS